MASLPSQAFYDCGSLTKITLPDSLTSIGVNAFNKCRSLTEIVLPESLTSIDERAFFDCRSLTEITLPARLKTIGAGAFACCPNLAGLRLSAENPYYVLEDDVLLSADKANLVWCSPKKDGRYLLPATVTKIWDYAFYGCSLTEISIPEGAASIGNSAFYDCCSLTEISLPDSLTEIGWDAFDGCSSLKNIVIPYGITRIEEYTFNRCSSLTEISLPDSLTEIGRYAFSQCRSLTGIVLPDSLTKIESAAFIWCSSLTEIVLPGSLTEIENATFNGCSSLKNIVIPYGVTRIGRIAFQGCSSLTEISLPDSLTLIEEYAFGRDIISAGCPALKEVYYSGRRAQWRIIEIKEHNEDLTKARIHCIDDPTVSYDANGGTGALESVTLTMSDEYFFPDCSFTAPDGWEFSAWSIDGAVYAPGDSLEITADTLVSAVWKEIPAPPETPPETPETPPETPETPPETPETPPETPPEPAHFVVSYDANGGSGSMDAGDAVEGSPFTLPGCSFTAPDGWEFSAWSIDGAVYAPGDSLEITADTLVSAVWKEIPAPPVTPPETPETPPETPETPPETPETPETPPVTPETPPVTPPETPGRYTLTGTITGHKDVVYVSVTARLDGTDGTSFPASVSGAEALDGSSKKECTYSVSAPAGKYSLVVEAVTNEGVTVNRTAVVNLKNSGHKKDINLPNGQAKSNVAVNRTNTSALVGGLDSLITDEEGNMADSGATAAEVTFIIGDVESAAPEAAAIVETASGQTLEFYDFSIRKTVDGNESRITDTGNVSVEIVLPFDSTGKSDVRVYRYHDGVDVLTESESGGERIVLDGNTITIYAKKFSVYGVGYSRTGTEPGTGTDTDTGTKPGAGTDTDTGTKPGAGTESGGQAVPSYDSRDGVAISVQAVRKSPPTGEESCFPAWAVACLLPAAVCICKRKKH